MRYGIVVADGCFGSGISALLDILATAGQARLLIDPTIEPFEVAVVASRTKVTTGSGMVVTASHGFDELGDLDVIVVPALGTMTGPDTLAALSSRSNRMLVAALAGIAADSRPSLIAAACTGVFPLAESGVLDGRRATTSWWLGPAFRERYPDIDLDLDAMVVADHRLLTAGAAFGHIDLALALVRQVSPELAQLVSRLLVIDERPAQSSYMALDHLQHHDDLVVAFERHVRSHLAGPLDVGAVAAALGSSRRTLERRVQASLGMTPLAMVQRLRVERAVHLMRTTGAGADQVASMVGYANGSTLRALLRRLR